MSVMDVKATIPVLAHYIARRDELRDEAAEHDRSRRPIAASKRRAAARLLQRALISEQVDAPPVGLGEFD